MSLFTPLWKVMRRYWQGQAEDVSSVRHLVEVACPDDPAAQYKLLILSVLLDTAHPHDRITRHVQDAWNDETLTAALLGGEAAQPVDIGHVMDLLSWCEASPARSAVAGELFFAARSAAPSTGTPKPPVRSPDPSGASNERDLLALMRDYRVWVGEPSYEAMATTIDARYVKSTLAQAAKGPHLPNLQVFTAYLEGCGLHGEELEAWRDIWRTVRLNTQEGEPGT